MAKGVAAKGVAAKGVATAKRGSGTGGLAVGPAGRRHPMVIWVGTSGWSYGHWETGAVPVGAAVA